jgi:hypothetical protein
MPEIARRHGQNPSHALLRSLLVPGWGQLANGRLVKAAIIGGGESALLWGMLHEKLLADDAREKSRKATTEEERAAATAEKDSHLRQRDNYGWWSFAAILYSIADAYVDAYLSGYDEEWKLHATVAPGGGARLGLVRSF